MIALSLVAGCAATAPPGPLARTAGAPAVLAEHSVNAAHLSSQVHEIDQSPFSDRYAQLYEKRAELAFEGAVKIAPWDKWEMGDGSEGYTTLVVVQNDHDPRVVVESNGLRMLLYVRRDSLHERLAQSTVLGLQPHQQRPLDDGFGIAIPGGTDVEVKEDDRRGKHITYDDGNVEVEGWVASTDVDVVFVPQEFSRSWNGEWNTTRATPIQDHAGNLFATLPGGTTVKELEEATAPDGYKAVEYSSYNLRIRGLVSDADLTLNQVFHGSSRCGGSLGTMGYGTRSDSVTLSEGDTLHARPGEPPFAIAIQTVTLSRVKSGSNGWHKVSFSSPWTRHEAWVQL